MDTNNQSNYSRRSFIKTASGAAAATLLTAAHPNERMATRTPMKVVLVGTGSRGTGMWGKSLVENYGPYVELVGLCDANPGRLAYARQYMGVDCPTYAHTDFERMIRETRPDRVIVTTVDATHHAYIIKGMELGCDVISEKPITTDAEKAQAIIDAQQRTGRQLISTFNVRYMPTMVRIKSLLQEQRIGEIKSVDFHWYLDTSHGASYFRRWHGRRQHSGTLLVHKASHHFDVLNWWVDSEPEEVYAYGDLVHYGKNNAFRSARCSGCEFQNSCAHYWDITESEHLMNMYVANEHHDGYIRDGCVWAEDIDIYDRMNVQLRYANGVPVSYSLNAFLPYEGFRIAFNGERGRLETWIQYSQPWPMKDYDEIRITDSFGESEIIQVPHVQGGHGGADELLKDQIFKHPEAPDPLGQSAGLRDGIMGVLIGIGAVKSIDTRRPVQIEELTSLKPRVKRSGD